MPQIPSQPGLARTLDDETAISHAPTRESATASTVDDEFSGSEFAGSESQRGSTRLALENTLSIATAQTESDLLARTLTAAAEVSGARVAAAIEADGSLRLHSASADDLASLAGSGLDACDPSGTRSSLDAYDPNGTGSNLDAYDPNGTSADRAIEHADVLARSEQLTAALARAGLTDSRTAWFGETFIVVAAPPQALRPDVSSLLALIIELALTTRTRLRDLDRLARQAESDPLTGLRHGRPFAQQLNASSPGRTAVIAVDVDDFKRINDEYGHQAGDHALLTLVEALRSVMRGEDRLYRIGGDEFAVIVDVNGPAEVVAIAGRLLEAARKTGQTVSVGAALHMVGETGEDTLSRADKALYQAKRAGRDTARLAPSRAVAA